MRTKILLAIFAIAIATAAYGEEVHLDVPIMISGEIGKDACPTQGHVTDLVDQPNGTIPVRSGPGENEPFREIDRLSDARPVLVCEHLGGWSGIVYGVDTTGCRTYAVLPVSQEYTRSTGASCQPRSALGAPVGRARAAAGGMGGWSTISATGAGGTRKWAPSGPNLTLGAVHFRPGLVVRPPRRDARKRTLS